MSLWAYVPPYRPRLGDNSPGVGLFYPLLDRKGKSIESRLVFNSLEFGGIKMGIVHLFPDAQKLDRVLFLEPFFN